MSVSPRQKRASWTGLVLCLCTGAASLQAAACGNNNPLEVTAVTPADVDSIAIEPSVVDATQIDQIVQFAATAFDASGNVVDDAPISWASSDIAVATVSQSGIATVYAEGETQITATFGNATGTASLTVTPSLNP